MENSNALCLLSFLVLFFIITPKIVIEQIRRNKIRRGNWTWTLKSFAIQKKVFIGMDEKLVELSWGKPSEIDQIEITVNGENNRWVYGKKNNRAKYVYFTGGVVSKIFLS